MSGIIASESPQTFGEEWEKRSNGNGRPALVIPNGRTMAELLAMAPTEPDWLVPGFAGRDWLLKLAAREKDGKNTFTMYLLACLERGVPTVFGDAGPVTTALIYTEDVAESIVEKGRDFQLARAGVIFTHEVGGAWEDVAPALVQRAVDEGHGLVYVDNISAATGVEDESGVELGNAAKILRQAARQAGIGAWINHHHKKGKSSARDKSRGGTALAAVADNNVELQIDGDDYTSRIRKLSSMGNLRATRWVRHVELAEDGTTYELVDRADTEDGVDVHAQRLAFVPAAGITTADFAAACDISRTTATTTLHELEKRRKIRSERDGRGIHWYPDTTTPEI